MSKLAEAIKIVTEERDKAAEYAKEIEHALFIRRRTINDQAAHLRGIKELLRQQNRMNASTKYAWSMYITLKEDHNMHLQMLTNLRIMLKTHRDMAYFKGLILQALEEKNVDQV